MTRIKARIYKKHATTYCSLDEFISIGAGSDGEGGAGVRDRLAADGGSHRGLAEEGLSLDKLRFVKDW